MHIGIHESETRALMKEALSSAGLSEGYCLVLFGGWWYYLLLLFFF
jgi:hypothetical protein